MRQPPSNLLAEQALLGGCLIKPEAFANVVEHVTKESFYFDKHKLIFEGMEDLFNQSKPVDIVTVENWLKEHNHLERTGGEIYLIELTDLCDMYANVSEHAKIIKKDYLKREVGRIGASIAEDSFDVSSDPEELLDSATSKLFALQQGQSTEGFQSQARLGEDVVRDLQSDTPTGVMSGYSELDEMLGGFQNSDLIILAARPSMGKTALALNIASNASRLSGGTVGLFSVEMALKPLQNRFMAHWSQVSLWKLMKRKFNQSDMERISAAIKSQPFKNIYIDAGNQTISTIRSRARKLASTTDLKLIVIDYLQLISTKGKVESQNIAIGAISRELKLLAKELNIPIIVLSQLSRALENRPDKHPMLSDLRDSGSIEQDADVVMFVYRQAYYDNANKRHDDPDYSNNNTAEIIVGKQRNGPTGKVNLSWNKDLASFEEIGESFF